MVRVRAWEMLPEDTITKAMTRVSVEMDRGVTMVTVLVSQRTDLPQRVQTESSTWTGF